MGAWDCGVFDDDAAYDVMEELRAAEDAAEYLHQAFDAAISCKRPIYRGGAMSKPVCMGFDEGIAASVCAAVLDSVLHGTAHRFDGFPGEDGEGSEQYADWIASIKGIECQHLKPKAVLALERLISEDSELSELWRETEQYPKWRERYEQMMERLGKTPPD